MLSLMEQCLAGMDRVEADPIRGHRDFHAELAGLLGRLGPYAAFPRPQSRIEHASSLTVLAGVAFRASSRQKPASSRAAARQEIKETIRMARTTLAERMSRLEQQKARLAADLAKIKNDERKARTRRLIEAGGLIEKAGLLDLDSNALYGALLSLTAASKDPEQVKSWGKAGGHIFDREAKARVADREPLTVSFPLTLPLAFTTRLRGAGLRWNKVMQHFEGVAEHDAVAALAREHDGQVQRVRSGSGEATP